MNGGKLRQLLQKSPNITALILCAAGVALNILLNAVAIALDIPLYLDTVGTIFVAALGGAFSRSYSGFCHKYIKSNSKYILDVLRSAERIDSIVCSVHGSSWFT